MQPLLPVAARVFHGRQLHDVPLLPSLVLVHVCEFAQVLHDELIGEAGARKVIAIHQSVYRRAVVDVLRQLMRGREGDSNGCVDGYMQLLVRTVLILRRRHSRKHPPSAFASRIAAAARQRAGTRKAVPKYSGARPRKGCTGVSGGPSPSRVATEAKAAPRRRKIRLNAGAARSQPKA